VAEQMPKVKEMIFLVAAEGFVAALSAEDNGDAFCTRFRHDAPLRIGGRTSKRFIVVIDHRTEIFPKIAFLGVCGVSNRLRFRERGFDVFALVEFPFFKTRRESLEMRFG